MSAILAIARADLRERSRTFGMLLVVAAILELGYLAVPDATAGYATVDLGDGWRGIYDSEWMGASTALLTATILPLVGFFLIRPAQARDALFGTYDLIASAPLARSLVVFGKWASNVAFLAALAALLVVAAIAMQFIRGEDRTLHLAAYVIPYLLVALPTCALTASLTMAVDAIPGLRGFGGAFVYFFVWSALLAFSTSGTTTHAQAFDPFGLSSLIAALTHGLALAVPHVHETTGASVGVTLQVSRAFRLAPIAWTPGAIASRAAWTGAAALLVLAVSPFALVRNAKPARGRFRALVARLPRTLPLPPLVRAELGATLGDAGPLWFAGALALTIAALALPEVALSRAIAPLVWIWPIGPMAAAGVMDVRARCNDVLLATPTPAWQRAVARTITCFALAALPVTALAIRDGAAGASLIAIALAVAAAATAIGFTLGAPTMFQGIALVVWYLGPVNHVPQLDPGRAVEAPFAVILVSGVLVAIAMSVTSIALGKRR